MTKLHKEKAPGFVGDRELASRTQRVLAAGRAALGTEITDGEQAIMVARSIADRLAGLSPDVRLAERRSLISLVDDLNELSARLAAEKARVEQRMRLRASHSAAERAYQTGETR